MKLSETMGDLNDWEDSVGLSSVNGDSMPNLDYIVNLNNRCMRDMDFEEMDETLEKISAYMVYLAAQKSHVAERLEIIKTVFDHRVNTATEEYANQNPKSYKTYGERKAVVLRTDRNLRNLEEKVVKLSAKLQRLGDLPRVVNDRLFTLRKIYERKINEHKGI